MLTVTLIVGRCFQPDKCGPSPYREIDGDGMIHGGSEDAALRTANGMVSASRQVGIARAANWFQR